MGLQYIYYSARISENKYSYPCGLYTDTAFHRNPINAAGSGPSIAWKDSYPSGYTMTGKVRFLFSLAYCLLFCLGYVWICIYF